jgi:integrase
LTESHSHYLYYLDLRSDGRIVLYKRADHQNPKWSVRLKIPGTKGFVVKSAKTDYEARRFAEDLYYQLEGRARRGESIRAPTFKKLFEEWSKVLDTETPADKLSHVKANLRRLELWALQFLGSYQVDLITDDIMAQYLDWRCQQSPPPAWSTLRNERSTLVHFFRFARRKAHIKVTPDIPTRPGKPRPRPDIPEKQWTILCAFLDRPVKRGKRDRFYLRQYILILGNSGLRTGEARNLRWRDISSTKTITGERRIVLTVRGKTGEREVVCNVGVERWVAELEQYRRDESGGPVSPSETLFCHPDGKPITSFKRSFRETLDKAGILYGPDGSTRVPYSLRHTYATMRLSKGVSVFQLAANMGTSVEMIGKFYGKKRVRDPKAATELTKIQRSAC